MDKELEKITRASEAAIRREKLPVLMAEPYPQKINRSNAKVTEFVDILGLPQVYVSTSGGKDSAVLSSLCRELYPNIQHILFNTGLEYQATIDTAIRQGAKVIPPKTNWREFCEAKGYPAVSKQVSKRVHDAKVSCLGACITMFSRVYHLADKWLHLLECDIPISQKCFDEFKKRPAKQVKMNPILGTRIQESDLRKNAWKRSGCNSYNLSYTKGVSRPISLWRDEDVDRYVIDHDVKLSELYTQYEQKRTGCVCCPYGAHLDGSRFDLLKRLEPARYEYFMSTKLKDILMLTGVPIVTDPTYMEQMEQVQAKVKAWHESKDYLTFKIEWLLKRYSADEIMKCVDHLNGQRPGNLMYPYEKIKELVYETD